jgi:UDP-N-acetylmuramyl pentapeptide phosphotransferase/UDP-N-acetylglucosamine-1-phosphate transferase
VNPAADALAAAPSLLAVAIAAMVSAIITWTSRPLLQRYALARPNARSSHRIPTPQGAGIAVISGTLLVASAWAAWANVAIPPTLMAATVLIALVGFADDIVSLPVLVRLVLQAAAVGAVVFTSPETARIVPALPLALERSLILLAGVWFVNLVNFMDGLDLMTVAEVVPVTAGLLLLGWLGELSWPAVLIAATLCGAMIGFAPFNKPVA